MTDIQSLSLFFLVFLRAAAFFVTGPLFVLRGVPVFVKVALAFAVSLLVFPALPLQDAPVRDQPWGYALQAAAEAAVGAGLGLMSSLVLILFRMAGHLVDIQIGFSMSGLFDPMSGAQTTVIDHFLYLLALVLFVTLDGHHSLILALAGSYRLVPLTSAALGGPAVEVFLKAVAGTFALAVQVAAPLLAVLIVTDMALGLIARTAPQMNIFMLGFPVKIFFGILVLAVMVPVVAGLFSGLLNLMENNLLLLMKGLS